MSDIKARWDLHELDVARSARDAALNVVARATRQREEISVQWATTIRLAHANGASVRQIAKAAGVSAQTVATICKR
jgi:hypothetical protein